METRKKKSKCRISMELPLKGGYVMSATKAPNKMVTKEEAMEFLKEARNWLDCIKESWEDCYRKEDT